MCSRRFAAGFTLVELMVAITIVAILAVFMVPSIREMIQRNRVSSYSNELITALALARSEAIRRGTPAAVVRSDVDNSDLAQGWRVEAALFKSPNTPFVVQKRDLSLKGVEFHSADIKIPVPFAIGFNPRGGLDEVNGAKMTAFSMNLIPIDCASGKEVGRTIVINAVGRIGSTSFACP
ncbi:MAG: GspH/FimT family pseudopilin [Zoogloeaceae bacterium]|nr:GspH/FimT family pseudopilin [Zoogloeaceae bacterium]